MVVMVVIILTTTTTTTTTMTTLERLIWFVYITYVIVCFSILAEIVCEPPNNHLNKYEGVMKWHGKTYSLDNDKVLLRGCVLRNTQWCYGIVIFAGQETKLMMNSGKTKFKRTNIDRLMNLLIIGVCI